MKIQLFTTFLLGLLTLSAFSQPSKQYMDSIWKLTNADYQDMLGKLKITSLRPGADGMNPNAPNAANYDESKANPFPDLPDPLTFKSGLKVTSAKTWWEQRRKEIMEDFDREILGRVPEHLPSVKWFLMQVKDSTIGEIPVKIKLLSGIVDNSSYPGIKVSIELVVTQPVNCQSKIPLVMELGFKWPPWFRLPENPNAKKEKGWQQQVLEKGWAAAVIYPTSFQADNGAGLTQGIIGLANKGKYRNIDDWGTLRAWAWGASRAVDYFESDPDIDATKVAIEGHSRFGKTALVAMAYDSRFTSAFISSSGEGGAKLHRRNAGEIVENLAASGEYHWMAGNFIKYAGPLQWSDLPVDAHELIALCAPRPVFISCGDVGDAWVDARGMFMATVNAGPVYRLLGAKDLGTDVYPPLETPIMTGELAFCQHSGGHTPGPNWPRFIEFASRYFNRK